MNAEREYLYHYFERAREPFLSLSDAPDERARAIQDALKTEGSIYALRDADGMYMTYRRNIERRMRAQFLELGGAPAREAPRYLTLGPCDRCREWYEDAAFVRFPLDAFDPRTVSFTYGDSFPTFDPTHGDKSEYRMRVYAYPGILDIVRRYGWPQDEPWTADTPYWKPGYVEAQAWGDIPMRLAEWEEGLTSLGEARRGAKAKAPAFRTAR